MLYQHHDGDGPTEDEKTLFIYDGAQRSQTEIKLRNNIVAGAADGDLCAWDLVRSVEFISEIVRIQQIDDDKKIIHRKKSMDTERIRFIIEYCFILYYHLFFVWIFATLAANKNSRSNRSLCDRNMNCSLSISHDATNKRAVEFLFATHAPHDRIHRIESVHLHSKSREYFRAGSHILPMNNFARNPYKFRKSSNESTTTTTTQCIYISK